MNLKVKVLDFVQLGGPGRTRTGDPRDANAMLSQLSYRPGAAVWWLARVQELVYGTLAVCNKDAVQSTAPTGFRYDIYFYSRRRA